MTRTTLLALASRVEAATGAGHNIDIEIFKLTDPHQYEARLCAVRNGPMGPRLGPADWDGYIQRPAYTASLDAAMSLVPSRATYVNVETCARGKPGQHCRAEVSWEGDDGEEARFNGYGKEPAPTLVAASLRAIAGV